MANLGQKPSLSPFSTSFQPFFLSPEQKLLICLTFNKTTNKGFFFPLSMQIPCFPISSSYSELEHQI